MKGPVSEVMGGIKGISKECWEISNCVKLLPPLGLKRQEEEMGKWIPGRFGTLEEGSQSRSFDHWGTLGEEKVEKYPDLSSLQLPVGSVSHWPNPTWGLGRGAPWWVMGISFWGAEWRDTGGNVEELTYTSTSTSSWIARCRSSVWECGLQTFGETVRWSQETWLRTQLLREKGICFLL